MRLRIFFSADVHGSSHVWRKWIRVVEVYDINVLILSGDLTGKVLVPIIKRAGGAYTARYFGRVWELRSEEEVKRFEERLEGAGAYYIRVDERELEDLKNNPERVNKIFIEKMTERLRTWLDLLVEKVDTSKVATIVMPGNDDESAIDGVIMEYGDRGIIYPVDKVVELGDVEMISCPYANPTPWNTPRELKEEELERYLEKQISRVKAISRSIFNIHPPPYNTHLDLAPKLGKDLKPITIAGSVQYEHVGSKAVRKVIKKYQPIVGLHGHIHESSGVDKIGKTVVVNPGSEYSEGVLRGYIVEIENARLINYWRVEG
ncbi:MAG: metallophosphoesterase [Zestosphaera sp.]